MHRTSNLYHVYNVKFLNCKGLPSDLLINEYKKTVNQCNLQNYFQYFIQSYICNAQQFQFMLSSVGQSFERTKLIQPLNKNQRLKVYNSTTVQVIKKKGQPKFSPFNTISREHRDSYLLRVTNEPNVNSNYHVNTNLILPLNRRTTIDRASFKRIIGYVKDQDDTVPITSQTKKRCVKSVSSYKRQIPLTIRDTQKWRKTYHNMDFSKQPESLLDKEKRLNQSTIQTFNKDQMRKTVESNFNNYERFRFKPNEGKSHFFESDSAHMYLNEQSIQKNPEYDTLDSKQQIIRQSLRRPKGDPRFYMYKDKTATRFDRADPFWNYKLQYQANQKDNSKSHSISFNQTTNRKPNDIHSKYPIRLSLSKVLSKPDSSA